MSEIKAKKMALKKHLKRLAASGLVTVILLVTLCAITAMASPSVTFDLGDSAPAGSFGIIDLLFITTLLALAPSIFIMMTSFTRIIIVLSFLRSALGTQTSPPNQVLIGMAIFLTYFIMAPVLTQINAQAYQPYREGELTRQEFMDIAVVPLKEFMLKQTYTSDLNLFLTISQSSGRPASELVIEAPEDLTQIGLDIIVPSFVTSELKRAFNIGFLLFIPFLIIDIVVSSTLMSMGMVMLPPSMIALPFKIMMFVLVDGWALLFSSLVQGFS